VTTPELQAPTPPLITVWAGRYRFESDDAYLSPLSRFARRYVDKTPGELPSIERFTEAFAELSALAPAVCRPVLDELAHRRQHPRCPGLYVVTMT
jgi:hypothetical protein